MTGRSPVRCAVRSKTPSGAAVAENTSPTPDPRTRGEHGTEHAAQAPFAVTRDYAAEVDEIRELGRKLGGEKKTPTPDPQAWREGYPYKTKLSRKSYERRKRELQIELLKMQLWVKETGQKVLIIFEGRDAAGKGGAIKRFNEHLNPRGARTVALEKPTEEEASQWYFQRYIQHLEFMRETPELERMLVNSGVHIIKFWFSVSQREQLNRFAARETDPVRRWKLSPTDLASLDKWDDYTNAKEAMFFYTHTADAPWTVVKSNDKKRARLEAIRHVLHTLPYPDKDERIVHRPDPQICGPANELAEYGEVSRGSFPRVR
nr:polyphosphate kinase 2 [Micrococcus luteus]